MVLEFVEFSNDQRRVFIDAEQLYQAYRQQKSICEKRYAGSMVWKSSGGNEYLFRTRGGRGYGTSLGVRRPETELLRSNFYQGKQDAANILEGIKSRLAEHARLCKAVWLHRVPLLVARILRAIEKHGLLGALQVSGTNTLFAYECMAGVLFSREMMSTRDVDFLWDSRTSLCLSGEISESGLLGILKNVDKTFQKDDNRFRAYNRDGFYVDLIKPGPTQILLPEKVTLGGGDDLEAAEVVNQKWIVSSRKLVQTVIGEDGYPALMPVTDPRSFVLYKLWLSYNRDRDPKKKPKDRVQALIMARVIRDYLPRFDFSVDEMKMFPSEVIDRGRQELSDFGF
jgi:hypothetical protein